jgi:hypothetical protein
MTKFMVLYRSQVSAREQMAGATLRRRDMGRRHLGQCKLGEVQAPTLVVRGDREYPMVADCADQIATRIPRLQERSAPSL